MDRNSTTDKKIIYLDNSATTELCDAAKVGMTAAMSCYGNPSSLHTLGLESQKLISAARKKVASALGLRAFKDEQIIFTASGTEASNMAILGAVYSKQRRISNKIVTTDSEHPSVENVMKKLEGEGFEVVRISTRGGVLDWAELERALDSRVLLVSMMMVNNETGAHYDVAEAFSLAKRRCPSVVTHCDAVQGFMKIPFMPEKIGADLMTISAHKINGPKGVGALYIGKKILTEKKMIPLILGGGQESGFRSGTENLLGIVGFGEAAEWSSENFVKMRENMSALREYAIEKLSALDLKLNLPKGNVAPHIINITLPMIKSETMLHHLSSLGVYVSSGSACSSHSNHPSSSLIAFGVSAADADCSLRISLGAFNKKEDIDRLTDALEEGIEKLVKIRK